MSCFSTYEPKISIVNRHKVEHTSLPRVGGGHEWNQSYPIKPSRKCCRGIQTPTVYSRYSFIQFLWHVYGAWAFQSINILQDKSRNCRHYWRKQPSGEDKAAQKRSWRIGIHCCNPGGLAAYNSTRLRMMRVDIICYALGISRVVHK